MKRRPHPLSTEQRAQLDAAVRHADRVEELVRIVDATDKHLRGAARELGRALDGESWAFENVERFGGMVSVISTEQQLAAIGRARDLILESYGQLVERYRAAGLRDLRESVLIRVLRASGWTDGSIAWELIDWEGVEGHREEKARRELEYDAALKRVKRYADPTLGGSPNVR